MGNKIKYSKLEIEKEKKENIMAIDKTRLVEIRGAFQREQLTENEPYRYIERRDGGQFLNKALYLPSMYDWVLGKDEEGVLCLVPLEKMDK